MKHMIMKSLKYAQVWGLNCITFEEVVPEKQKIAHKTEVIFKMYDINQKLSQERRKAV